MGGGVPPLAVIFFPLTFWPAACRDGGRGGVPPSRHKAVIGVFERFPNSTTKYMNVHYAYMKKRRQCQLSNFSGVTGNDWTNQIVATMTFQMTGAKKETKLSPESPIKYNKFIHHIDF